MNAYKNIKEEKLSHYILKEKCDVYRALKSFFKKEEDALV